MEQIKQSTIEFLKGIKVNNNRDWFIRNKRAYIEAKENFETFIQQIINSIVLFDSDIKGIEVKNCVYRFNRDIRFTNDKSPYKSHFGAYIVRGGKVNGDKCAGYYIHVEPGNNLIAGGAYMPPTAWLTEIRQKIDYDPDRFIMIINSREFKRYFGTIMGEKLKKAPKGFPNDHPNIELLKYKSYLLSNEVSDKLVTSADFFEYIINVSKAMKPFNDFLNEY
jgi:uncharacterized protein (TIGR02453 family)